MCAPCSGRLAVTVTSSAAIWPAPTQLRLCMAHEMAPNVPSFNHSMLLYVPSSVDSVRLRAAVEQTVADHEALRGRFAPGGEVGWRVSLGPPAPIVANGIEFSSADLEARIASHANRPFQLEREAPVRIGWWEGQQTICQLTFHHVATDARTLTLLLADVARRYASPALGIGSHYYRLAQERWLREDDHDTRLDAYALAVAEVDLDPLFADGGDLRRAPAEVSFEVGPALVRSVMEKASDAGVTRFAVWLTAWARALSVLLDRSSFPLLVPVSTRRSGPELETVGFFVNSVVLPLRPGPQRSFDAALLDTSALLLDALGRRDLPLQDLSSRLDLDERGRVNPLTSLSAQLLPALPSTLALSDGVVGVSTLEADAPRYQLSFDVAEHEAGARVRIRGDAGTLELGRLRALGDLLTEQVEAMGPQRTRGEVASGARHPETSDCPQSEVAARPVVPPHRLLGELRQLSAVRSDEPAIRWAGGDRSWADLGRMADHVRSDLGAAGVEAGDAVLVELPRGPAVVAALIAVLELDAVAVMGRRELGDIWGAEIAELTDAAAHMSGTSEHLLVQGRNRRGTSPLPAGTAYVSFTSGSSGRPKGVATPAAGACEYLDWIGETIGLTADDRCLQLASPGFDAMVRDTLAPLRSGATIVLAPDQARLSGAGLHDTISRNAITVVPAMVPPQFRRLLAAARSSGPLPSLRAVCIAGEPLFRVDVADLARLLPNASVRNLYGPTEATMTTTSLLVEAGSTGPSRLPVGNPHPGAGVHIVDGLGREQPHGAVGEVVITGSGLSEGYLCAASEDASRRFRTWSFGGRSVAGYATGDLGHWLDDGEGLRIEGRLDAERKLHGERIDLAAIEAVLVSHAAVEDVAVGIDGTGPGAMLTAQVVWSSGERESELRAFAASALPPAARPRRFTRVARISRLANGKIDRRPVDAPSLVAEQPGLPAQAAWPVVCDAVQRVTGLRPEDPRTSLFELGCDSLQLIEIAEVLGLRSGHTDRVAAIFDEPRGETLVALLDGGQQGPAGEKGASLVPVGGAVGPDLPTLVACPHAGGDVPVFGPLADGLDGAARVLVLRRPSALGRGASAAAWLDEYLEDNARSLAAEGRPPLLCGYSVGFTVAYLLAQRLVADHDVITPLLVGINPSLPGIVREDGGRPMDDGLDGVLRERLDADLLLRDVRPVAGVRELPSLFLVCSTPDALRWDRHGASFLARFGTVTRHEIDGDHVVTPSGMRSIGATLRPPLRGQDR